jgi:hypothetical protein
VSAAPPVVLVGERESHAPRVSRGRSGTGTQPGHERVVPPDVGPHA